jgi:hypothetical protein
VASHFQTILCIRLDGKPRQTLAEHTVHLLIFEPVYLVHRRGVTAEANGRVSSCWNFIPCRLFEERNRIEKEIQQTVCEQRDSIKRCYSRALLVCTRRQRCHKRRLLVSALHTTGYNRQHGIWKKNICDSWIPITWNIKFTFEFWPRSKEKRTRGVISYRNLSLSKLFEQWNPSKLSVSCLCVRLTGITNRARSQHAAITRNSLQTSFNRPEENYRNVSKKCNFNAKYQNTKKMAVLWVIPSCSLEEDVYRRLERACCFHHHSGRDSETSVNF